MPARYLKRGQAYWSKSYRDPYSLEPMVTCTMPMWQGHEFKGVATIDLKLAGLSEFMSKQAKLIGGYAFAVDRNDRLLSLPNVSQDASESFNLKGFSQHEYPTIHELAELDPEYTDIANRIMQADLAKIDEQQSSTLVKLSKRIAAESYQIKVSEARGIAVILLGLDSVWMNDQHFEIHTDPILEEASSVSILAMPKIGWKVIIVMPARYADEVVSKITFRMLSLLFILLFVVALAYILYFNAIFLAPMKKMTLQIRKLVSREDYLTKLNVEGNNELSQLASWFDIRTAQLSDVLDKLKSKNLDLTEAREAAEQANRSKNIFLASMSHDIRTPMNGIIGMSEFLSSSKLDADQENYVHIISSSAQALLSLVNDIMDFSKIDANQLDLEEIPFDLRHMMDDCADLLAYQTSEKRLEFVYYLSPEINRHLLGDPNRIRQIIVNLTSNAVKFTSSGRVELWLEAAFQSDQSTQLLIEVRDTGIGLSHFAQQNLFSPFVQGDSSTTREFGGTGLGLTICKHLAEMMGGSISFRSEEGVGTTFIFKLKLKSNRNATNDPFINTFKGQMVLILGQNHFQNSVIESYVKSLDFKSETIPNLPAWLVAQENSLEPCKFTICTDVGLLGDLSQVLFWLSESAKQHYLIVLRSSDDASDNLTKLMPSNVRVKFISLPLKYDDLIDALSVQNRGYFEGTKISSQLSSDLITHGLQEHAPLAPLAFLKGKRILMVEDNKVNQKVLMIMLNNLGLSADVAIDGVEGVEKVKTGNYDLILMDWQMPRMDGLEATRKIRSLKDNCPPIIIAVTANAMSGDVETCLEAGMDDYLSKPVQRSELEKMIRKWLKV